MIKTNSKPKENKTKHKTIATKTRSETKEGVGSSRRSFLGWILGASGVLSLKAVQAQIPGARVPQLQDQETNAPLVREWIGEDRLKWRYAGRVWENQTEASLKKKLGGLGFKVLFEHATERAFSDSNNKPDPIRVKGSGVYCCKGCNNPLFEAKTQYDSMTGWPSFWDAIPNSLGFSEDRSWLGLRIEYHCAHCGGHHGHVFEDGPKPTGKRYCSNGVVLQYFEAKEKVPGLEPLRRIEK